MAALDVCPKCGRRGYVRKKEIYGHKYYYFVHFGSSEKPKEHYLGRELPTSENQSGGRKPSILAAVRRILRGG
jgi:hypothetical protein